MYQHTISSGANLIEVFKNAEHLTAEDLQSRQDIYLFDDTFKWTYIQTHEQRCGPYFVKLS